MFHPSTSTQDQNSTPLKDMALFAALPLDENGKHMDHILEQLRQAENAINTLLQTPQSDSSLDLKALRDAISHGKEIIQQAWTMEHQGSSATINLEQLLDFQF
jgi:hypothetical protein